MNITDISGIGDATAKLLKTHGIDSVEAVATAEIEQLAAVPGIGPSRAAALRESARRMLPDTTAGAEGPDAGPAPAGDDATGPETVAEAAGDDANAKRTKGGKGKKKKKKKKGKKKGKAEKKKRKKDKGGKKKKNKRK